MNSIQFKFNPEKAQEAILYIASCLNKPDIYSICKVFYLADKAHLERFGRTICGDEYVAMERGPVPSKTYDIMKDSFGVSNEHIIEPKREANLILFSESDQLCLDEMIKLFKRSTYRERDEIIHDRAYNEIYDKEHPYKKIPYEVIIANLKDADLLLKHLME